MLKQLLVSLVVLIVAAAGYVYFVPGADVTLRNMGLNLPLPTAYAATGATPADAGAATPGKGGAAHTASAPAAAGGGRRRAQVQTVITGPVTMATINDKLTAIGEGTAAQSVNVTTQAIGTLVSLDVKPGDVVKAGQTIGQLDADAEQIAYDQAQLTAKDTADALARTQTLAKTNAATAVQLSTAQLAASTANLQLRSAKLALDKRSIVTPIDGTVGLFQITTGNAVGAQTVVTTVDDTSNILVNFWVPERYVPVIHTGMPVTARATALPAETFAGTVSAVDSRIDPASRTLQVQAKIPNSKGTITAGMSFEVTMGFPGERFPAVDPLAIQWGAKGPYVWRLTADSKVSQDPVQIIQRDSDGVLVKGDLKPGDQVVTQGVLDLTAGAAVRRLGGDTADAATGNRAPARPDSAKESTPGASAPAKPGAPAPAAGAAAS